MRLASGRASGHKTSASTVQYMPHLLSHENVRYGWVTYLGNRLTITVVRKNDVKRWWWWWWWSAQYSLHNCITPFSSCCFVVTIVMWRTLTCVTNIIIKIKCAWPIARLSQVYNSTLTMQQQSILIFSRYIYTCLNRPWNINLTVAIWILMPKSTNKSLLE